MFVKVSNYLSFINKFGRVMRKNFLLLLLAAMFTMVSCANNESTKQQSEEELYIDNLMAQCQNFDSQTLVQKLPGGWVTDSVYGYDENWQNVKYVIVYKGNHRWEGSANYTYTYATDGTGNCHIETVGPANNTSYAFNWQYNPDCQELVLDGERRARWRVSGFNNEYLIVDYPSNNYNMREVYKRKAE